MKLELFQPVEPVSKRDHERSQPDDQRRSLILLLAYSWAFFVHSINVHDSL